MLSTIPPQMLRHSATVYVPTGIDADHVATGETVLNVRRCCIQQESRTKRGRDNTPVEKRATLFSDYRATVPHRLDWAALKRAADSVGGIITVEAGGERYTVQMVATYLDDDARVHHYEAELI